jgi:hypothetical protein
VPRLEEPQHHVRAHASRTDHPELHLRILVTRLTCFIMSGTLVTRPDMFHHVRDSS